MKDARDIIKRPVITEHSADLMADKKYTFEVDPRANKTEIKQAVETVFGVKVIKVNTMNLKGKFKRMGRYGGFRPNRKKAIVELSEDSKELDISESERLNVRREMQWRLKYISRRPMADATCLYLLSAKSQLIRRRKHCFVRCINAVVETPKAK